MRTNIFWGIGVLGLSVIIQIAYSQAAKETASVKPQPDGINCLCPSNILPRVKNYGTKITEGSNRNPK